LLADVRLLYNLQNFPKDRITGETIDLMVPYITLPDYNYQKAKQACGNVAGLLSWTVAMGAFYAVNKDVLPLKVSR